MHVRRMTERLTFLDRRPWLWLLIGAVLIFGAHVSFGIGILGWLAPIPFLRHVRITRGARARIALFGALVLAWTAAVLKLASEPMMVAMAPLFGLPIAIAQTAAYVGWGALRGRVPPSLAAPLFAGLVAVGEWALHALTPFGTWGATGYSQLDDLPLLQVASIAGIVGVGVIVNLVAAWLEEALASPAPARPLALAIAVALVAHVGGGARLALAGAAEPERISVAAIATDSDIRGLPLPSREATHAWDRALLDRTRRAAASGAQLVVWTEAATLVWPDEEEAWLESVRTTARESAVDVVAGYIVPVSTEPLRYRNEYRLVLRDGTALPAYAKYHPVPGEPAIPGTDPAPIVDRPWGRLSGAICYDYDFPELAIARARAGADLVALPSSDWRGIDPVHGQMAAVRAIEGGHSLIRSTRWGLSVAADPYGRIRAWRSAFEPGPDVMMASLPHARVATIYGWSGDTPVLLGALVLCLSALRRRARGPTRTPVAAS